MFFLYDANLKLLKTIPSDVYQGSDGADDIYFLVPINPNAAINVAFLLPTGKTLTSRAATKQGEAVGLETPDGISYAMWSITLTAQETAYAGNVTLQITVISGAMRMTSQKGVFPVLTGVPPVLPEAPQADAYNEIRAAIAALQTAVYNTKAIGISTYSYNESKKNASIKSYVTSATRVVVPDYVIKGDEYYIVTGIDTNVKPPTSVTEYEFGSNITSIGAGAFMETKIKSLEFPKNLTSIGASAFTDATTTEFVFNGAVPTIGSFAFSGVNATVYVPTVYYDDYVTAFKPYPGIVVQKKSETLADVIRTADEAKAIALKAQSTADEVKTELDGKVDRASIVQTKGDATDKVMSQKAVTDAFNGKLDKKTNITNYGEAYVKETDGSQKMFSISSQPVSRTLVRRTEDGAVKAAKATANDEAVNLGQAKELVDGKAVTVDQSYSATSENPQSGKAVAKAIEGTVVYAEVRNDTGNYPFSGKITAAQAKSVIKGNTQFCFRGYKTPSEPLSISFKDYRMFSTYYVMPYNVDMVSPSGVTLQTIYVGSSGKKLYMEQCVLKSDGSYTVTDVAENGWLLVKAFKTIFGQSITESGNIALYKHHVKLVIDGLVANKETTGTAFIDFISSNNLVIDSLTDLKTLLGDNFVTGVYGFLNVEDSGQFAIIEATNTTILATNGNSANWNITTITDTVTEV